MHNETHTWMRRTHYRWSANSKKILWATVAGCAVLTTTLTIITMQKKKELADIGQLEEQLTHEVTELDILLGQKKLLEDLEKNLSTRLHKIQKVTCTSKNSPYPYLKLIERIIPDRVIITQFTFGNIIIRLEGYAYTTKEITTLMHALTQSKIVQAPKLVTINRRKSSDTKKINNLVLEQEPGTIHFIIDVKKT